MNFMKKKTVYELSEDAINGLRIQPSQREIDFMRWAFVRGYRAAQRRAKK